MSQPHSGDTIIFGGIEAGGTKFVCGVGSSPDDLARDRQEFRTEDGPGVVLPAVVEWFQKRSSRLNGLGIAAFGPIDLDETSPTFGRITTTPKLAWRNVDLIAPFKHAFGDAFPIAFDTDVNGAALGEHRWGAARNIDDFVYVTIGTGLGAGAMVRGQLLHGLVHPEMGHMLLPRIPGDPFPGVCTRHGACWEGLCCGTAIGARAGKRAELLDANDSAWTFATRYTAYALANLICVLSPRKIIVGGSVRKGGKLGEAQFFQRLRDEVQTALAGYIRADALRDGIADYIVPPQLGDDAGLCGAIELARRQVSGKSQRALPTSLVSL